MHNRKLLYIGDNPYPACFQDALLKENISISSKVVHPERGSHLIARHCTYFKLALFAVLNRKNHDIVFIWQQYIGYYYRIVSMAFPFGKRPVIVCYIIYKNLGQSVLNSIKVKVMKMLINSTHFRKVIFLSKNDALFEHIAEDKRIVISDIHARSEYIEKNLDIISSQGYFFSGGASNRKYSIIKHVAALMPDDTFKIACLNSDKRKLCPLPENVEVYTDAYNDRFDELVLACKAVIIPLEFKDVVSGQLVCLKAMQAGKVLYISNNLFIEEWIPGVRSLGFIHYFDDYNQLCELIKEMSPLDFKANGRLAREYYLSKLSDQEFYSQIVSSIRFILT